MNPDDDDAVINQLKHPRFQLEVIPKTGIDFIRAAENRRLQQSSRPNIDLQAYAEDELVKKQYRELRCELPGTPRSTFLMVFSPDGTRVASTHGNHNIYVTDLRSGKNIKTLVGHPRTPWCIAFHPTCNELVASGCLGGQVRIWDLSGGSEVWTAGSQTVIASIAFHPNDRILVIATYNELYFWDWSKPKPFTSCTTGNTKEKVRYVAFDKLGHKLITGIANTPQSRWERSRATAQQCRWERNRTSTPDRSSSPYRRRMTPRLVNFLAASVPPPPSVTDPERIPLSSIPERERRITACYRNLVHEYELLVHRYLQVYRPPPTTDRGTDPMEIHDTRDVPTTSTNNVTPNRNAEESTSTVDASNSAEPSSSTGPLQRSPKTLITFKRNDDFVDVTVQRRPGTRPPQPEQESVAEDDSSESTVPQRRFIMRATLGIQTSSADCQNDPPPRTNRPNYKIRIKCSPRRRSTNTTANEEPSIDNSNIVTLRNLNAKLTHILKRNATFKNRHKNAKTKVQSNTNREDYNQPGPSTNRLETPSTSVTATQANTSTRGTESNSDSKEPWRLQLKRLYPGFFKKSNKTNRKPIIDTSSESSSSEDEDVAKKRVYRSHSLQNLSRSLSQPRNDAQRSVDSEVDEGFFELQTVNNHTEDEPPPYPANRLSNEIFPQTTTGNRISSTCQTGRQQTNTNAYRVVCLSDYISGTASCEMCRANGQQQPESSSSSNVNENRDTSHTEVNRNFATTTTECHVNPIPSTSSAGSSTENGMNTESQHATEPCARTLMNTDTHTTNSTVYTPSSGPRLRFVSHVLSAFLPTRVHNISHSNRSRRLNTHFSPSRNRLDPLDRLRARSSVHFPPNDEVINYSERVNSEDDLTELPLNLTEFHPFDPPPEFPSINPENIGIGNMYSNIVQDLESSLNNVRNIRASTRPGETSDMLSSFSERLESIMQQSESILRNLRHTMDMLPNSDQSAETRRLSSLVTARISESFNDPAFYVRDLNASNYSDRNNTAQRNEPTIPEGPPQPEELYSNRNAIASDHTYPRNPESPRTLPSSSDNLTPLMTSLHLTISHIQRQARLLILQVDSIERIDRAMLEVAQLQMVRQLFGDVRRHLSNLGGNDHRSGGVSSVRQMMAGTRISDSSPCDSPAEDESSQTSSGNRQANSSTNSFGVRPVPSTTNSESSVMPNSSSSSSSVNSNNPQLPRRVTSRKSFPPSRLLHMQRQNRRFSVVNLVPRRGSARDRLMRRRVYLRTLSLRPNGNRILPLIARLPTDFLNHNIIQFNSESLLFMTRKLENLLTEHIRQIGRPENILHNPRPEPRVREPNERENVITRRLNNSRTRMNTLTGLGANPNLNTNYRVEINAVTPEAVLRFNARDVLSLILDTLTRFFEESRSFNISQNLRVQVRNVIDLALLLCDILLLHIVDSIPPPTGMNLDPERESLSARIEQMCSRVLQSRLSGQNSVLTRSLRLMRLTARYATRALGQTYNERRNALFSCGNSSRRELLGHITSTLHNINRNQLTPLDAPSTSDGYPLIMPVREWYQTINAFVSRYNAVTTQSDSIPSSSTSNSEQNLRFTESTRPRTSSYEETATNSDENENNESDWYNNNLANNRTQLYRTNNVNLLSSEESAPSTSQSRSWNVPTVQINDVTISDSQAALQSRISQHRYRLSELRSNPTATLFRPRFLHPLYAGVNPFDTDLDDPQREHIYDTDMILTVSPNHRIQAWDISTGNIPDISNSMKNIVVGECRIHNDASVDVSSDGTILVTLLPSGGYPNVTNRLGVYSLRWETLGQCLYITSFEQNAVSVSLSPLSRHLVVGLASRRASIVLNYKWTMARIFLLNQNDMPYGSRLPVIRELEQTRDTNYMSLNCIRWLPVSGQGLIYATNTGQLRILT